MLAMEDRTVEVDNEIFKFYSEPIRDNNKYKCINFVLGDFLFLVISQRLQEDSAGEESSKPKECSTVVGEER